MTHNFPQAESSPVLLFNKLISGRVVNLSILIAKMEELNHSKKNIREQVALQFLDINFLFGFLGKGLLTLKDVTSIDAIKNPVEKCLTFYEKIWTRANSYGPLKIVFEEAKLSGSLKILNRVNVQNVPSLKCVGSISYDKSKLLRGTYNSKVFQGRLEELDAAVKIISVEDVELEIASKEIDLLTNLDNHPNIIRYFKAEFTEDSVLVAMEFCRMNLTQFVRTSEFVDEDAMNIIKQVTEGIIFLHSNQIVHRDLKPDNILMFCSEEGKLHVKLSDFGITQSVQDGMSRIGVSDLIGNPGWMAPEVTRQMYDWNNPKGVLNITSAADIFSLGCVFYFVLTCGAHPFGKSLLRDLNIINGRPNLNSDAIKIAEKFRAEAFIWLINQMIKDNVDERPKANIILAHPTFWETKKMFAFLRDIFPYVDDANIDCVFQSAYHKITRMDNWNWLSELDDPLKSYLESNEVDGTKCSHLVKAVVEMHKEFSKLPDDVPCKKIQLFSAENFSRVLQKI